MMRYQIADYKIGERLRAWASAMQQDNDGVTIGNNPILPLIIHKTWSWPAAFMEFYFDREFVGLVSFVKARNKWVSIPHFDHDSLWVNYHLRRNKIAEFKYPGALHYGELNSLFYGLANQAISELQFSIRNGTVIQIFIEATDFKDISALSIKGDEISMICRNRYPVFSHYDSSKVIPTLTLKHHYDEQFESLSSNVRRKIRKSHKNGIRVKIGDSELVNGFYTVYRKNIRSLGSFGLPKSFFQHLIKMYHFGFAKIIVAEIEKKPIGAAILLNFATYAENGWFASLQQYNRQYVTYVLHDAMIRYAIDKKCKVYSFGRSTNQSSGHRYKRQWGTKDIPMVLSSTKKTTLNPGRFNFVSGIIKVLPVRLLNPLDKFVSKIIY